MKNCIVFFWILLAAPCWSQNIFDAEHSKRYGDYLLTLRDYKAANTEYLRCFQLDSANDTLKESIAQNYFKLKDYSSAVHFFNKIQSFYYNKNTKLLYLNLCRSTQQYKLADSFVLKHYASSDTVKMLWKLEYQWNKMDYKSYRNWLKRDSSIYAYNSLTEDYYSSMMVNPPKSPLLAATLSTIIPGLGKIYTHDRYDGIVAMISIGTSAIQAYRGFHYKGVKSVYGWIFGSVGVGLYLGNIYGSWKSAKKYNTKQKQFFKRRAETMVFNIL